jgi:hypothetical protein
MIVAIHVFDIAEEIHFDPTESPRRRRPQVTSPDVAVPVGFHVSASEMLIILLLIFERKRSIYLSYFNLQSEKNRVEFNESLEKE